MRRGRAVAGVVLLVAAVVVAWLLRPSGLGEFQAEVRDAGPWAPVLFLLAYSTVTVAPVPRTLFTLAAGLLFGWLLGVVLAMAGTALAALLAFQLVRMADGGLLGRFADRPAVRWLRTRLDRRGALAVASVRLVPFLPFSVQNYGFALSGVRVGPYALGTVLGVLPGTVNVVVLGDAVTGDASPALLAISLGCGLLGLLGIALTSRAVPDGAEPTAEPVPASAGS